MLQEKLKGVKSIADVAKIEGAVTDTIHHITFMSNAFVSKIGASEPALSGSVSKAKKGDFKSGLKGKAAIIKVIRYFFMFAPFRTTGGLGGGLPSSFFKC